MMRECLKPHLELASLKIKGALEPLVRRPRRSLSVGNEIPKKHLQSFASHQSEYIHCLYTILDCYSHLKHTYTALDELWMFLLELCYLQQPAGFNLFEAIHKQALLDLMEDPLIQAFRVECSFYSDEFADQFVILDE